MTDISAAGSQICQCCTSSSNELSLRTIDEAIYQEPPSSPPLLPDDATSPLLPDDAFAIFDFDMASSIHMQSEQYKGSTDISSEVFFFSGHEYHDYCRMYDHCQVCSYHYHMMSISSFYILHHESVCIFSIIVLLFYVIIVLLAKTSLRLGAHNNHVLYVHNCFCICIVKQHASLDN